MIVFIKDSFLRFNEYTPPQSTALNRTFKPSLGSRRERVFIISTVWSERVFRKSVKKSKDNWCYHFHAPWFVHHMTRTLPLQWRTAAEDGHSAVGVQTIKTGVRKPWQVKRKTKQFISGNKVRNRVITVVTLHTIRNVLPTEGPCLNHRVSDWSNSTARRAALLVQLNWPKRWKFNYNVCGGVRVRLCFQ